MADSSTIINAFELFKSVYDFLKEIKGVWQKGGIKLFSSRKMDDIERKYREALIGTKNAIESSIWWGKGFAIAEECGPKADSEFHHLMGLVIHIFNDFHMRLDPQKLDERLVDHLTGQLKILEGHALRFWNIQGIGSHQDKEKDAMKLIEDFRSRLRDFQQSMDGYLRPESPRSKPE